MYGQQLSGGEMMVQRFRLPRRASAFAISAALLSAAAVSGPTATAQSSTYTCFPSCTVNDGRMLALAGSGNDAFAGNAITIGIGLPPDATTLEVFIFDGDTGGKWDVRGASPQDLVYEIYADPNGNGTGMTAVTAVSGSTMVDNAWSPIPVTHTSAALAPNGNYVYLLKVTMPAGATSTSAFKLRTNGTITVKAHQSFSISAPMTSFADAAIIYPDFDGSTTTSLNNPANYVRKNYDGVWNIYLDVPEASTSLKIWDGDMDYGSALDASIVDTDDPNTPNERPEWATANAFPEGTNLANPKDDNGAIYNRHSPSVRYDVIFPGESASFANNNPSGNLEWEQFRIDTEAGDPTAADATATEIPAGIYTVRVVGMDMLNVNAWRFFNDVAGVPANNNEVIGVNEIGLPVAPIRAVETVNGSISGTIYYDSNEDSTQNPGEPGLPTVGVKCHKLNSDGTVASTKTGITSIDGNFTFSHLGAGSYKIEVESSTLQSDVIPTVDADGATTAHTATLSVSANQPNMVAGFGYKRGYQIATGTRGYWTNHPDNWPVGIIEIGGVVYTKAEAIDLIFQRATRGDKSYSMAAQLLATKLNLLSGSNSECIGSDVEAANAWLVGHPLNGGRTPDAVWATGSATHDRLDDYNNGLLCAPHMN
jgi:hypothetical protein